MSTFDYLVLTKNLHSFKHQEIHMNYANFQEIQFEDVASINLTDDLLEQDSGLLASAYPTTSSTCITCGSVTTCGC